jgi:hypothetical protein
LIAPQGGEPRFKIGQVSLGFLGNLAWEDASDREVLERGGHHVVGIIVTDDEGRRRVVMGGYRASWGLHVNGDTGRRRAALWADGGMCLYDEDETLLLTLAADRADGGRIKAETVTDGAAVLSGEGVALRKAHGAAELVPDEGGRPVLRIRSDAGAQVELGTGDGSEPRVQLRDADGKVQTIPPE